MHNSVRQLIIVPCGKKKIWDRLTLSVKLQTPLE